ncbi:MAG: hypothetical protein WBQ89_02295 [Candidatus Acidiferrum sp.]
MTLAQVPSPGADLAARRGENSVHKDSSARWLEHIVGLRAVAGVLLDGVD